MSRRAVSLVAAIAAATAGLLPIVTSTAASAAPVVQQQAPVTKVQADAWEDSPVYKKWVALGGANFAGDKVGDEVVQSDGIRYAKFSKNVIITWKDGVGFAPSQRMSWSYTFSNRHSLGMSLSAVREYEYERQFSLYGRYWFSSNWAVSAETVSRESAGMLRLQDFRIGVQRAF